MYETKLYTAHNSQYFMLLCRFSQLGVEAREFLLRARMIGRVMEFFFEDVSPFKEKFRSMADIQPVLKDKPDIGLPTKIDKNQVSYYQEIYEKRRQKQIMDAPAKWKFILEMAGTLALSCKFGPERTAYQLDDLNWTEVNKESPEFQLFYPESKFMKRIVLGATKNRSISTLARAYCHLAWQSQDHYIELIKTIYHGL